MAAKKKPQVLALSQSDPRAPLDAPAFLSAAQRVLAVLSDDLLTRADESPGVTEALKAQWELEKEAKRTGDPWEVWRRRIVVQIAAAWVLSLVFARTLEDRGLLERNRIAGPGALDSQEQFRGIAPYLSDRDYLLTVFQELSNLPAAKDLFDPTHNPVWKLGPSISGARVLLDLFRAPNPEEPAFRFGQSDTNFLGDLYQHLDTDTRERFALLQTPRFVESFILNETLEPAIREFGLDGTTLIDPACGSGHFLLGAFARLVEHRLRESPGAGIRDATEKALRAVHGVDVNPYAVAIARFRLVLAFVEASGYSTLAAAPVVALSVVVADSLLHGRGSTGQAKLADRSETVASRWLDSRYTFTDEAAAKDILSRQYAVVVGNPPYVRPWDDAVGDEYRLLYRSAYGQYSMAAPFCERFFSLARASGFVGQITSASIATQDFAKPLVTEFLPERELFTVVDTSNVRIPGHGTPTIVLLGRNRTPTRPTVRAIVAKPDPEGIVVAGEAFWEALPSLIAGPTGETNRTSVLELDRAVLGSHPWKLVTDIASQFIARLVSHSDTRLGDRTADSGRVTHTGEDSFYYLSADVPRRHGFPEDGYVPLGRGHHLRDWSFSTDEACLFPYSPKTAEPRELSDAETRFYWPYRCALRTRSDYGKTIEDRAQAGRPLRWFDHTMFFPDRFLQYGGIAFPTLATHNHFVAVPGRTAFNSKAPVLYLRADTSEKERYALLAYLNSSTASFWIKQEFRSRASTDVNKNHPDPARAAYELSTRRLGGLPIPRFPPETSTRLATLARHLTDIAGARISCTNIGRLADAVTRASSGEEIELIFQEAWCEWDRLRQRLVFLQEEVDWIVYEALGLVGGECVESGEVSYENGRLSRGQRDFESGELLSLIRKKGKPLTRAEAEVDTARAAELLPVQRRVSSARRAALAENQELALLETRVYKRLWRDTELNIAESEHRKAVVRSALLRALLTLCERLPATSTAPIAIASAGGIFGDQRAARILEQLGMSGGLLCEELDRHAIPFSAAYRYSESGLERHRMWTEIWKRQRQEDLHGLMPAGSSPDYEPEHFREADFWRLRGKLDVPSETFVSYPGCASDEDGLPVYGWAGWNHLQRAIALATLYLARKQGEAWSKDRLVPMLAGLDELLPWIWQWHPDPTPESGGAKPGQYVANFLSGQCQELRVTLDEVRAWRPASKKNGASAAKKTRSPNKSKASAEEETP